MPRAPISSARGKRWCFTLNNYTEAQYSDLVERLPSLCDYVIIGRECGAGGTRHLQGYCEFKQRYRLSQLKNSICAHAHLELAVGTGSQNTEYCSKEDPHAFIHGVPGRYRSGHQGSSDRSTRDVLATEFISAVDAEGPAGARSFASEHPGVWLFSGHTMLRNWGLLRDPQERPNISVRWYCGPPGVGKSRKAHEELPQAYLKDARTKWWNGYMFEKTVIIDDLAPRGIDIVHLLVWFDRYKCRVETKGSYVALLADTFIVTSNFEPEDCYPGFEGSCNPHLPALLRRINITRFT